MRISGGAVPARETDERIFELLAASATYQTDGPADDGGGRAEPSHPAGTMGRRRNRDGMGDETILLVEDNPDDEVLTRRALRKVGLADEQIAVAHDGVEALDYLFGASRRPLPRLVLLDLKLPKVDGIEVLRRIRADERTRLLPVVILTSSREQQNMIDGHLADGWILRTVDFDQFTREVERLRPLLKGDPQERKAHPMASPRRRCTQESPCG
jgi:two-component system response regulator